MKRGEIKWYKFKASDKNQPALILNRDSILECLGEITVAPITSTLRDIPSEVFLSNQEVLSKI
jgi:mRNA interferase MazF